MSFFSSGARRLGRFLLGRFGKLIATPIRRKLYAFEAATHHPQEVQQALLKRILEHQADTGFGRDHHFRDDRRGWNIWGLKVFRDHPETKFRPIVQLSGDWNESQTEAGTPCGAVTGLTARMQWKLIRWLYCVPACVGEVKDVSAKYYLVLR